MIALPSNEQVTWLPLHSTDNSCQTPLAMLTFEPIGPMQLPVDEFEKVERAAQRAGADVVIVLLVLDAKCQARHLLGLVRSRA